ncbi:MAG: NAD(P)/FAD-dependent oxidoreductase [Methanothrix sp.]|uniref:2,3-di-O-geranylgeranylglyceryl phosphate reductase n=1 Tax=Methanothrix thermoacetophila (strain DSM 6194 / JCM 14653 / NBRC 101360 / PT) TaxID=349307 RepID=A0B6Y7_METTP|nr:MULTISPECIES: NAD(P)/FAD-dependent oxidoreductase [Methanothrix]ABK14461.1 2,3-di-O-geranylgeranylglyceryl phosphate reductase [Methanothrix thermoacetophila PT]MBC7079542.1 NAD(P)/FAD-dependent oxidoreductase [Methanothrix sp.]NPU87514.1 NAD(P)/FAD-dependent oxidoreductase [Methanothrix sp.]
MRIIVVGAGPAGSTAAETAARLGADVILVERRMEIGSPVQCGGFIPEASELRDLLPDAVLPETLVEIPERCILNRTRIQRLYAPSGRSAEFPVAGRCVDRRSFDRYLAHRAARAGAQLIVGTEADVRGESIHLKGRREGIIDADIIIGADGPSSRIAEAIGAVQRDEPGICLEYEMVDVDIDRDAAEMYFGERWAPGGYAWIIPLGDDIANVGVGVRRSYIRGEIDLPLILRRFVEEHPHAGRILRKGEIVAVMRGIVPSGGMPEIIQSGRFLLAGDAAGHVMATSGGGVPLAMVAGRIAGEVAATHARGGDLNVYTQRIEKELGAPLRGSVIIRRMVDRAMRSDRSIDMIFSLLDPMTMKDIQRGRLPAPLERLRSMFTL